MDLTFVNSKHAFGTIKRTFVKKSHNGQNEK